MAKRGAKGTVILLVIVLGCLLCEWFIPKDPTYMDLSAFDQPPGKEFWFGTDSQGRDIFSMIWYGGRISLLVGVMAALISTAIGLVIGAFSAMAPGWLDRSMMYFTDIWLSIPSLLLTLFFQGILGKRTIMGIAFAIGITGWPSIAKVVRIQVRQIRNSEYIIATKAMGCGFFHILWVHLTPALISSIMFMIVMNLRSAILAEATLSFMGMGFPLEIITWGSMLSLAENAFLSGAWWMILIPGGFLITTLFCVTSMGEYIRRNVNTREGNL